MTLTFLSSQKQLTEGVIIPVAHYRRKIFFPQPNVFFKAESWFISNAERIVVNVNRRTSIRVYVCVFYCMNSNLNKQNLSKGAN